jgi:uncharacterized glyoxalase superfamily protein PhnB
MDRRPTIFPELFYRDAPAAIDWLCDAFGFERLLVVPGEAGHVVHAELGLGNGVIMLASAMPGRGFLSPRDLPGLNGLVCAYVDDVDAHHDRAAAQGAEVVVALSDTDYGARMYEARDLEGNYWCFGNYRTALPA